MLPSGNLLDHRYQLISTLGEGGMGTVYRASDRLTGETVALKRMLVASSHLAFKSRHDSETELRTALVREFQTLASLRHPNIISVRDYGFDENGQLYFTMTLLENPYTLSEIAPKMSIPSKVRVLIELLQALAYLHRRRILHRALKPGNVLVDKTGTVKVLDSGLAVAPEHTEEMVGTLAFMAPEMLAGKAATPAADLYAVGVIAYMLFAGQHPFDTSDRDALINDMREREPDLPRIDRHIRETVAKSFDPSPEAPTWRIDPALISPAASTPGASALARVVGKLLQKETRQRYSSAYTVIADLCEALRQPIPEESPNTGASFLQTTAFVGREKELNVLHTALDTMLTAGTTPAKSVDSQAGGYMDTAPTTYPTLSTFLIGGESGVGKSRLLEELRIRALAKGGMVLHGQAVEDGGLPYQVWRAPVRRLLLSTEVSAFEAGVLREIVPDIDRLIGQKVDDAPELEGDAARQRLILTIGEIFTRQPRPLLLMLEDLQWADESLEVLRQINRSAHQQPLLIVGSFRDDECPTLPDELPGMSLIRLDRLPTSAAAELSEAMLGSSGKQPEVVELLQRETEGNTFFVVEAIRALAEEAGNFSAAPPAQVFAGGILNVLRRRINRVPAEWRDMLKAAAVAGRQLDLDVLAFAGRKLGTQPRLKERTLDTFITACANAAVLDYVEGQWRFSHDKLRASILADLTPDERPMLHRRVAVAIEMAHPENPDYAAMLVKHWHAAENTEKAQHYARLIAEQAVQ